MSGSKGRTQRFSVPYSTMLKKIYECNGDDEEKEIPIIKKYAHIIQTSRAVTASTSTQKIRREKQIKHAKRKVIIIVLLDDKKEK